MEKKELTATDVWAMFAETDRCAGSQETRRRLDEAAFEYKTDWVRVY
ncbi:hypothetical protein R83H12_01697 [Fibrobacteria bacterium R8-3-H12]